MLIGSLNYLNSDDRSFILEPCFRSLPAAFLGLLHFKPHPWSIQPVPGFHCSEPNSVFRLSLQIQAFQEKMEIFGAFRFFFCIHLKPVLVQVLPLCPPGKAMLPFGACSNHNIFVEFMPGFPCDSNSLPQPPVCGVEIILLPYLVSLINVVEHSDSDKQARKAQRK